MTQSCNATPVIYNQTACGPSQPRTLVSIYDNGTCVAIYSCYYSPNGSYYYYYIPLGTTVTWFNYGTLPHTATSSPQNPASLQVFNSGPIAHYGSFSFTFTTAGNYSYYDSLHPVLHGNLLISNIPQPPPPVSSSFTPTINLDGSVSWTVYALDNNVAVLNVSHQVSIVASLGPVSFTPATETGSFSQSIDLATRVQSSGTATSVILGFIKSMFNSYPGYYGYYPSLSGLLSSQKEIYTIWWVNGPLANGQPVEILTGYSGVTGSESVTMGPSNNRNAWIVDSEISESVSTQSPPIITSGGSSDSSFKLDIRLDYDQASDLLVKSSAVISTASSQTQNYKPGDYLCGPSGCFPVSDQVTVNHHMTATIPLTLQLTSTNLDLSKRMSAASNGNGHAATGGSGDTSPATTLPSAMSLMVYAGIGIAGTAVVGTAAWLLRRRSKTRAPLSQPSSLPSPGPTVTGA